MLLTVKQIFTQMDSAGIPYCHWKSNEHLQEGLDGTTDLDILVDRRYSAGFFHILNENGVKRFRSMEYLSYTGIDDYIGIDRGTGSLFHLHVHFELVIGKKFIKNYHLPWEQSVLETRILDKESGVYIAAPEMELLLLLIRVQLKTAYSPKHLLRRSVLRGGNKKEFLYLLGRIDRDKLKSLCETLEIEAAWMRIERLIANPAGSARNKELYSCVERYRSDSDAATVLRYYTLKARAAAAYLLHKKLHVPRPYRRRLYAGGMIIAVLGIDGSGKSTILKELRTWLSWKIDLFPVYFGSGDGKSSLLRAPLAVLAKHRTKKRGDVTGLSQSEHKKTVSRPHIRAAKAIWAVLLGREKLKKLRLAWKGRSRGMVVLCDRYPQSQFFGMGDGPLLQKGNPNSRRARRELEQYRMADKLAPDLVIKLEVSLETALKRKHDTPRFVLENKSNIINGLAFPKTTSVVNISTETSFEETIRAVKNTIWDHLYG